MTLRPGRFTAMAAASATLAPNLSYAGATPPLTVSWSLVSGNVAVPTLGTYGTFALALLVGAVLYAKLKDRRNAISATLAVALTLTIASGTAWVPVVKSQIETITIAEGGTPSCNDSQLVSGRVLTRLENNCPAAVRLTYTINTDVCTDGEFTCLDGDEDCVANGGTVPANEAKSLLELVCGGPT